MTRLSGYVALDESREMTSSASAAAAAAAAAAASQAPPSHQLPSCFNCSFGIGSNALLLASRLFLVAAAAMAIAQVLV